MAAISGDIAYYDAQSWQQYLQKFPEMAKVPIIAQGSIRQINVEKIIELQPDLVILSRYAKNNADEDSMLNGLTKAGIPVVYVDLRVDLLKNTVPSMRLLGKS